MEKFERRLPWELQGERGENPNIDKEV